ncbi:MAG: low molecular weight protein arginine phosphatase [Desulfobacterales bacterium]|nr:low molecular weight protein arginine phosphatase [Desulfobacterales bacterium]
MKNVLFVCTANICRSPFAERALKKLFMEKKVAGIKVHSAGVSAVPGLSSPPDAIRIAGELGVDISEHLSRPISVPMIEEADIILVMSLFHREVILEMSPESENKLKLLGSFSAFYGGGEETEIPDPYGLSSFHYRSSFNIIRDCIYNLYKELISD